MKKVNNTFKRNLIFGFGFSLIMLMTSAIASYISINDLLKSFDWVDHTNDVNIRLGNVMVSLVDAETGMRGYLITGEDSFLEPYNTAPEIISKNMLDVALLTSDNGLQRRNFNLVKNLITRELQIIRELIQARKSGATASADRLALGKIIMDKIRGQISIMNEIELRLLNLRSKGVNRLTTFTLVFIAIASFLSVAVTIFYYVRIEKTVDANEELQAALEHKRKDSERQISMIKEYAEKIAGGKYDTRIDLDELKSKDQS